MSGKQFRAILERQSENNIDRKGLRLVIKINERAIIFITYFLNDTNYFVAVFFALKVGLDHQFSIS